MPPSSRLIAAAPVLFVFLWSTGFIGAKLGLPDAEPLSFLLTRYLLVIVLMTILALAMRAPWPRERRAIAHIAATGVMIHGGYLGGVFVAISLGLSAGAAALIAGLQPLLTAVAAGLLLGEHISRWQWIGLGLGLFGVTLVVTRSGNLAGHATAVIPAVVALFSITAGTLYQKRFCPGFDLRTGSVIQFIASALVTTPLVLIFESYAIHWTPSFLFALGWLTLVLSFGAMTLLNLLIRTGSAVNVASLFYLTPVSTAIIAWLIFDERLTPLAMLGMVIAVTGVALARRPA